MPLPTFSTCRNCNAPLPEDARYCPQCAQKRTDGRISFGEMMREFSETVFNVDSRFFKTIVALFIPGKLTEEYFAGRHRSYVHPLRVFLVMTIALVASATFELGDPDFMGIGDQMDQDRRKHEKRVWKADADSIFRYTAKEFSHPEAQRALDSVSLRLVGKKKVVREDSLNLARNFNLTGIEELNIAWDDLDDMPVDTIIKVYNINGYWNSRLVKQQIRMVRSGDNFGFFMIGNGTWMALFMMPILALLLKIFYIRRGYYYVEHLIFSFHTHSFAFLIYIVLILFAKYAPAWILPIGFVWIGVYLYKAIRRVYGQGWLKTAIKYALLFMLYLFVLCVAVVLTFLASFALY